MTLALSFAVRRGGRTGRRKRKRDKTLQAFMNGATVRMAPEASVKEIGNVLPRLFDFMNEVPSNKHIHLSKMDLADGCWRMIVKPDTRWNFAHVLPSKPVTPIRIVVPRALQMGWNESPACFCATTETVGDTAQTWIAMGSMFLMPTHPMEPFTVPTAQAKLQKDPGVAPQMSTVCVDEFLLAAVKTQDGTGLAQAARVTLHTVYGAFPSPQATGLVDAKDPTSEKKLGKRDARWDTRKEILGFWLHGVARTSQLPPPRAQALVEKAFAASKKKRIALKNFRLLVGKMWDAAHILPAARAFFAPLNNAMPSQPDFIGLEKHSEVGLALNDVTTVISDLLNRPEHVRKLVQPDHPDHIDHCDASGFGACGAWFGSKKDLAPIVWRITWPSDTTNNLVLHDNPNGTVTNSDLEMAGVELLEIVLETRLGTKLTNATCVIVCDDLPAVTWVDRMATGSTSPISCRLLKGPAMRQRMTQSAPAIVGHAFGVCDVLANVASHKVTSWAAALPFADSSALSPTEFLTFSIMLVLCHGHSLGCMSSRIQSFARM